jgi:MoxR-like ATPase
MDRFFMRIAVGYPDNDSEVGILERNEYHNPISNIGAVLSLDDITSLQESVKQVRSAENVKRYITALVRATRGCEHIRLGVSPRGGIALFKAAKALAFINGRDFIVPEDVKACAARTLAHRVILSPKGKSEFETQENMIKSILDKTPVPKTTGNS